METLAPPAPAEDIPLEPTATSTSVSKDGDERRTQRHNNHRRSNSFIMLKHVRQTPDEVIDQAVSPNVNAEWVNMKGACECC